MRREPCARPVGGEDASASAEPPLARVAGQLTETACPAVPCAAGEAGGAGTAARAAPDDPPIDVLLARLAGELEGLARIAAALDADIGLLAGRPDPAALRRRMQDLDLLRQMASDLAVVQRHVAELMPTGLALPLDETLGRLQLGEVALRLRSGAVPAAPAEPAHEGSVDLF